MFRKRGFIFRNTVLYTVMVRYGTLYMHRYKQSTTYQIAYTDACITYQIILVYTSVFLKMNPRVRNM